MWNGGFKWVNQSEQEKSQDAMRTVIGSLQKNLDTEDQLDIAQYFINAIAKECKSDAGDIIKGLYERWRHTLAEKQADIPKKNEISAELEKLKKELEENGIKVIPRQTQAPKAEELSQASGIKAAEKYKMKDAKTIEEVRRLISAGKNYSEISRELQIDRRTAKGIALRHGFVHK